MIRKSLLSFVLTGFLLLLCREGFSAVHVANFAFLFQQTLQDTTKKDTTKVDVPLYSRDRYGNPVSDNWGSSPLLLKRPSFLKFGAELDTSGRFFRLSETLGGLDYRPPSQISYEQFKEYQFRQKNKEYFKSLSEAKDIEEGAQAAEEDERLIPPIELSPKIGRFLGGNTIDIRMNGNVVLDFGGLWQRVDNPQIPIRQQRNGGFNFDQQIGLNLSGKIGEAIELNTNFDTKNAFQFEQVYNLGYTAEEQDIVQDVQFGNVSFPVSNSLITGAQNLFGISTRLRFGKLYINAIASSQRGTSEQIKIKNGAQSREFEIRGDAYDVNRHFFLAHFFRDTYEQSLNTLPVITSGIVITRVEAYVTNRNNNTQTLRNVVGLMDLAEGAPFRPQNPNIGQGTPGAASNDANALFANLINNPNVRNPDQVSRELENNFGLEKGGDFELLRGARKLEPNEFTFHPQLGYVSLVTPLRNDEILAVSYEYTFNGQVFRVGELNEDYSSLEDEDAIILKMLTPSTIRTDLPIWDLMMKNIYLLQANQLQRENFQLRVIYRDDLTGIDNPNLQEGARTQDIPLIRLMNLDRLNPNNDPQPDGNFDFIDGITIDRLNGRVIFPVLEPFGSRLESFFDPESERQLVDKFVFDDLYSGTQADANLNVSKNKFFIKGSYQSGSSNEIILPGINIAPNSVVVRAGNTPLTEGIDFTVDYQFGRVRILNEGVLGSGREITIQYERADLFSLQTRNLVGLDAEYHLSKDIRFTGTVLRLNERPIISRVSVGSEPVQNTLWGFGVNYRSQSRLLTKIIDKIPFISTNAESSIDLSAEFAQLIPGAPRQLQSNGTSYLDDFEGAEIPYDLTRTPTNWVLGSTPELIADQFPFNSEPLGVGYKRAKLAWYTIDNAFYFNQGAGVRSRPTNITDEDLENHYVRLIPFNEVFPNRQRGQVVTNEISFDMAYYPEERGQYNYNPDLTDEGKLKNPEQNFGAVTRAITHDIDFDNINIQYIEFWLMDPFISGQNGQVSGENNNSGGQLYFNLGNISEDVMPDGRHFFENGLVADTSQLAITEFGRTPTQQFLTNAFDADEGTRQVQDVGFDGLSNNNEQDFFQQQFLSRLPANLNADARQAIIDDPSADDFLHYFAPEADAQDLGILERYLEFNGMESNSPVNTGGQQIPLSSTTFPDNEDLNRDNTISDIDQYYQYRVDLEPNRLANNPFVVDQVTAAAPETGDLVNWYQFRIPIRGDHVENVGNINSYKSIRFIRMFMTGWRQPVVLRMVQFQLVGAQWRPFLESLEAPGLNTPIEPTNQGNFEVGTVNIEENGQFDGENTPYTLPPGAIRDFDATSTVTRQLNEQSLSMCIDDLQDKDARAVYKNLVTDLVNYKRLKINIHADSRTARDGDLTAFVRLGTDFSDNYYEIELPLTLTPIPSTDPNVIWPEENQLDLALEELYLVKAQRNRAGSNVTLPFPAGDAPNVGNYKVSIVGNPDLSSVQTVMLGVRNPSSEDGLPHSVCAWFNELRVTDFDNTSGWATNVTLQTQLADFAVVRSSLRYSTVGFGGIQDKISNRSRSTDLDYDISSNINLDKFLFGKVGLTLPLFVAYERSTSDPFFDPLDPDVPTDVSLQSIEDPIERARYKDQIRDFFEARSINLSNISKKKMRPGAKSFLWDVENLSLSAAYSDSKLQNIRTELQETRQWQLGAAYAYSSQGLVLEPFKNLKVLDKPYLQLIKDFNLNLLPSSIAVRGQLDRRFMSTQLRNSDLTTDGIDPFYEKQFLFNRAYNVNWQLTQNLGLDYSATANAIIDEPEGDVSSQAARDSIITNLQNLGRMKLFTQTIGANYKVPFDKIPFTDFLNSDVRYAANYQWTAGSVGIADSLGNTLQNGNTLTVNGRIDLTTFYNKFPILERMNKPKRRSRTRPGTPAKPVPVEDPLDFKKERFQTKLDIVNEKIQRKEERKQRKLEKQLAKEQKRLEKLQAKQDSLQSETQLDSLGNPIDVVPSPEPEIVVPPQDEEEVAEEELEEEKPTRLERRRIKFEEKIALIEAEQAERKARGEQPSEQKLLKGILKGVTMVKDVNVTYSENNSTILPGFMLTPRFFGFDEGWNGPGLPFILGSQDPEIRFEAARNGWLATSFAQNNPFSQVRSQQLTFNANVEPISDLKIQLQATKTRNNSYSEVFRYIPDIDDFESQTPLRTGSYGVSFFLLRTAFVGENANNESSVFQDFQTNRSIIKSRLDELNPNGEYDINSQDVLIPAFLSAYSGADPGSSRLHAFPDLPIPNWRLTYAGLNKLEAFQDVLKSMTITHGYQSDYSVGNYTSSLFYGSSSIALDVNERDVPLADADENGELVPLFVTNQVVLSEKFAPLIGVNLRTASDFQINVNFNRGRDMALNLTNAQVTENRSNDVSIDIGYTKAGMRLPFPINGVRVLENDVTMRMAFTLRDTKTVQRRLEEGSIVTAGNMNLQFRPTISYVFNKRANLQMYFERTINDPRVSNSFRRSNTAFGVQVRYNLSQ